MKPILFDKSATIFTTNGLGRLECHSCQVTEERNGQYELELQVAEGSKHADQIEMTSIIVVKVPSGLQAFRVYRITKPLNGVFRVYANHISYQLSMIPTMPFEVTASAGACQETLDELLSNAVEPCPFTFTTDVTTVASYKQTTPSSIRSRLGGTEGSVLDQFGGEYEWDNFNVILHRNRGAITPTVTLRYGKNITDINQEENISNTITGIVPFWTDNEGNLVTLPEKVVNSPYASSYPFKRTVPQDFSDDFEEQPTEAQLRTHAQAFVTEIGLPVVSIKLSFVNLADTEEFKDLMSPTSVSLCDNITVQFEKYGISTTAKIVKTVYDVLGERYDSLEIGSLRSNLATTISDQNAANVTSITAKFNKVGTEIDNATAWLTSSGGYVVAVKNQDGSWKELLFLDDNDIDDAVNVLRINENGIGFSSNGVAGPYTQAWTLDGRLVIGGTNVPSITVYDSQNHIIFQASADAMIWNATNSSMDANGYIRATGAVLTNAQLTSVSNQYTTKIDDSSIEFLYNNNVIAELNAFSGIQTGAGNLAIQGDNSSVEVWADKNVIINADEDLYLQTGGGAQGTGGEIVINADDEINISSQNGDIQISTLQNSSTVSIYSPNAINVTSQNELNLSTDELYLSPNELYINQSRGETGTVTYINDLVYDRYTFATDLDINMSAGYANWTNVTLDVAVDYTTDSFYVNMGLITSI